MSYQFGDYVLDPAKQELRQRGALVDIEPQVFDLLLFLIRNRERVVSKDDLITGVWHGRIVSESTLTSRINAARRAVGDTGVRQDVIRTIARKGLRFVGDVAEAAALAAAAPQASLPKPRDRQEVHLCTSADGVRIAYGESGTGPVLIKAANWLNHLEYDWASPLWTDFLHALASENRLTRYDARGCGLSDWDVPEISFDAFVRDLEAVVDATGHQRFALFGMSQGCAVSIAYAARHPERVSRLVLYGGFARGRLKRGQPNAETESRAATALIRQGWANENPAFRQMFTSLMAPDASQEQMRAFNDMMRKSATAENAARIREANDLIEVTDLLAQVKTPTLVMHCRNDALVSFDEGRRIAAGIPGATFVALEGRNHVVLPTDPVWDSFIGEIQDFLRG